MTTITFDTHKAVKELKNAGFPEQQAEAITRIFSESIVRDTSNAVTKADLSDTKADIIRWVSGIVLAQSAFFLALFKLMGN
jgi:hypothetical protein